MPFSKLVGPKTAHDNKYMCVCVNQKLTELSFSNFFVPIMSYVILTKWQSKKSAKAFVWKASLYLTKKCLYNYNSMCLNCNLTVSRDMIC